MPTTVKRISLFKIPKEEDIDAILGEYHVLRTTAQKVGVVKLTLLKLFEY